MTSTSRWEASDSPTSLPIPETIFTTPGGKPASSRISPSSAVVTGVREEALHTAVLPAASAGQRLRVSRWRGKLKGLITATTP